LPSLPKSSREALAGWQTNNIVAKSVTVASQLSYAEAVNSGTPHTADTAVTANDGFTVMRSRGKKNPGKMAVPTSVIASRKTRKPLIGVCSCASLPVMAKSAKTMSLFVS
jgi:hypothetical protein